MSTEHYEGWKLFDKVAVIEKPISESERGHWYTKYPYPQAYICDAKDKKMMATGINWGTWVESGRTTLKMQNTMQFAQGMDAYLYFKSIQKLYHLFLM